MDGSHFDKTTLTIRAMRELLSDPAHWIRGNNAETPRGRSVEPRSPKAARWCLVGAAYKVATDQSVAGAAIMELTRRVQRNLIAWNDSDTRTHEEVLNLLDGRL